MNILMLVTRRQYRGAEVSASNLSKQLVNRGYTIFWVGLFKNNKNDLSIQGATNADLKGSDSGFINPLKLFDLISFIKKHRIDIIQANGSDTLKYAVFATLFNKRTKIIYRNISIVSYWINRSKIKKLFFGWLMSRVNHVVSVGENSRKDFIETYQYPENKISVIKRGIPVLALDKQTQKNKLLAEWGLPAETHILIWAGSLSKEKNPELMIDIAKDLNEKKISCIILICGKGKMEEKLKDKIAQLNINNIKLMGYQKELSPLLAAADVLVLTSFVEGIPGIILEAAAQKTPAVASNVGGVSEALIDKVTGFIVEKHESTLFSEKIIQLLKDKTIYNMISNSAHDYVVENYNEEKKTDEFVDLYKKLVL